MVFPQKGATERELTAEDAENPEFAADTQENKGNAGLRAEPARPHGIE